jgi:hypothetical protein
MPGTLVVMAIVVAPVLLHTVTKTKQTTSPSGASSNQLGHKAPPPEPSVFMQLLSWIGVVIAIGVAAFGAFCAAFFAICTGGLAIGTATGSFDFFANFLIVCLMGGIVAAVIVAVYVFRAARPRRN